VARAQAAAASSPAGAATSGTILERLFLRDGELCWFVPLREVKLFTAEGNYVRISWDKIHPLLGRPLSSLESRLDSKQFFRANRQQILNLEYIESVELGVNGRLHVQLRGGPEVQVSRRQARLFRQLASV
jgi:two-component system LytT family response regulator